MSFTNWAKIVLATSVGAALGAGALVASSIAYTAFNNKKG